MRRSSLPSHELSDSHRTVMNAAHGHPAVGADDAPHDRTLQRLGEHKWRAAYACGGIGKGRPAASNRTYDSARSDQRREVPYEARAAVCSGLGGGRDRARTRRLRHRAIRLVQQTPEDRRGLPVVRDDGPVAAAWRKRRHDLADTLDHPRAARDRLGVRSERNTGVHRRIRWADRAPGRGLRVDRRRNTRSDRVHPAATTESCRRTFPCSCSDATAAQVCRSTPRRRAPSRRRPCEPRPAK